MNKDATTRDFLAKEMMKVSPVTKKRQLKIEELLAKRTRLVARLMKSLEHLPLEQQFYIVTSFMSVDKLKEMVEFQERG